MTDESKARVGDEAAKASMQLIEAELEFEEALFAAFEAGGARNVKAKKALIERRRVLEAAR